MPDSKDEKQLGNSLPVELPKRRTLPAAMAPYSWKKGQSGNPNGRPKNKSLEEVCRSILGEEVADGLGGEGEDRLQRLARVVIDKATDQEDIATIKLLMERLWPAPKTVDLNAYVDTRSEVNVSHVDVTHLSDDEQSNLRVLARKAITGKGE